MTGLDPVIHALLVPCRRVDARIKSGHDDMRLYWAIRFTTDFAKPDSRGSSPAMTTEEYSARSRTLYSSLITRAERSLGLYRGRSFGLSRFLVELQDGRLLGFIR